MHNDKNGKFLIFFICTGLKLQPIEVREWFYWLLRVPTQLDVLYCLSVTYGYLY